MHAGRPYGPYSCQFLLKIMTGQDIKNRFEVYVEIKYKVIWQATNGYFILFNCHQSIHTKSVIGHGI